MDEKINEMIQLIYYDLNFNDNFEQYVQESGSKALGKNYDTVAIIGCQSSGKSTLLNSLFDTNFKVMQEEEVGRGQTTQGIWVALNSEYKVMIFDCEGTDSKERGEDRFKFEHCSSLFALAMADVLIINMWSVDVGRYTASNYGVLKIVFEMNLKLFHQECAKRILIVLRDFDDGFEVKKRITDSILNDIHKLWSEIKKPEKFKDYSPDKFFEFEFATLAHRFHREDQFNEEILEMRKRFTPSTPNYIFRHVSSDKIVPLDGIAHYCKNIWDTIISDKDLNIPSQKEMLANYKCNELKEVALITVDPLVDAFIHDSAHGILDNFAGKCEKIKQSALTTYDETAKDYLKHVYEEIRRQLVHILAQKMYVCFDNQAKKLIPQYQKNMKQELEKELKNNNNFFECALFVKKKYLDILIRRLESILCFENWKLSINEFEELFDEIIESQRRFSLDDKKAETIKKLKSVLEDTLIQKLDEISQDFWTDFNIDYFTHFHSILFGFKDFLREYYKVDDKEFIPLAQEIEEEVHMYQRKDLYKKSRDISNFAVESFRKGFWYEDGIPRVWNKMDEGEIDKLYDRNSKENNFVFDMFRKFKLLKNPLKYFNYDKPEEETFTNLINNLKQIVENEENVYEDLLSETDIQMMKAKYAENIQNIYEDAKRRHLNIQKQTVPIWAWVLIVYLGYDDVLKLIQSYWIIPAILLLAAYGVLHVMGMGHMPKMVFSLIKNTILSKTK